MSLNEYVRVYCAIETNKKVLKSQGKLSDGEKDGDDEDAHLGDFIEFWKAPRPELNWRESLSMKLTDVEADYLKKQMVHSYPENLLSFLLNCNQKDLNLIEDFDSIEAMVQSLPESLQRDYKYAKTFSDFVYGIHLRYNLILSEGDRELDERWHEWHNNTKHFRDINFNEILKMRLKISNTRLISFFEACKIAMVTNDMDSLDTLIIKREKDLKGIQRAKLYNINEHEYKGWVGLGHLDYRLRIGMNLIKDIREGLGELNV